MRRAAVALACVVAAACDLAPAGVDPLGHLTGPGGGGTSTDPSDDADPSGTDPADDTEDVVDVTAAFHGLTCPAEVPWTADAPCDDAACDVAIVSIVCGFLAERSPVLLAGRGEHGWEDLDLPALDADGLDRLEAAIRELSGLDDAELPSLAFDPACAAGRSATTRVVFDQVGFRYTVGTAVDHVACPDPERELTWVDGYATMAIDPACADELGDDPRWTVADDGASLRFEGFAARVVWTGSRAELEALAGEL